MVQRLREVWHTLAGADAIKGSVEVDGTHIGGLEKNKHKDKKGTNKKSIVVGIRNRNASKVASFSVPKATQAILDHFIDKHVESPDTLFYTDSNPAYNGRKNHESMNHSVEEYVRSEVHTMALNRSGSCWSEATRRYFINCLPSTYTGTSTSLPIG